MRKLFTLQYPVLILLFAAISIKGLGQISVATTGTAVTQNFDVMLGTSATAPLTVNQWRVADNAGGTTWAGANRFATTQAGGTATAVSAGGIYNYGNGIAASAPDRALGFLSSGTNPFPGTSATPLSIYAQYNNATGSTVSQLSVSFDYEKYRNGTNVNGWSFNFYYSTDGSTWTNVPDGNQTYAANAGNTAVSPAATISKSVTITGLSIPTGSNFYLRWSYFVSAGTTATNAQGLAIDNVSLTASANVNPVPVLSVTPSTLNFANTTLGNTSTLTYLLTGTDLTEDVTVSTLAPYSVSADNSTFNTSLNVSQSDATSGKTIYVKFSPTSAGSNPGSVNNVSTGASTKTVTLTGTGVGLISLATSPYIQNFNGIGTALPTGVTVRTGATVSALGTNATFSPAHVSWNNTTGAFKNFASGNNEQGVSQSTATDRALGVRQIGAFGDPGAAFVFQVANTTGKINFGLDFNLQSLDAGSERVTTWRVDYGFGIAPTTFTVPATTGSLTTGGFTFSNNPVHVDFGNALDDQPGVITIRIVAIAGSTGNNNRPSTGIDDFNLTWEDPSAKTLSLSTAALNFPTTNVSTSNTLTYNIVSQTNLDQPIELTTTAPYTISTDNVTFTSALSIAPADAFNKTVYVKFSPVATGVFEGSITHSSEGITPKTITLSGEAVDPGALTFNFNTCSVSGIPGSGFLSVNVTGSQKWGCSQFGRNSTNGVSINGFANSAAQTNDAWLISPALNLNNIVNLPVLSFYSRGEFTGPKLQLYVSTTYSGSGTPNISDWVEIPNANFPTPPGSATTTWTLSDNIDLSAYKSAPAVYIAFRYTSSSALNAARWSVDDIAITDQSTLLSVSPVQLSFGEISVGSNSASQPVSFQAIGSNDITVTPPTGYQLSTDNTSFTPNAIVIGQATAAAGTTLYVRFSPVVKALTVEGNINVTSEGLNKDIVSVTGSSYPKSETFDVAAYNISFFGSNSNNNATQAQIGVQIGNITTVMNRLNMDVIGIEEMSKDSALNVLVSNMPGYASVVSHRWSYSFEPPDPTFPPQKIGFIYNTSTMTLSTTEPPRAMFELMYDSARLGLAGHRLTDYPNGTPSSFWGSGRLPFLATFDATINGVTQKVRLVVIHAKSGGDAASYARRQYDIQVLKDSLDVLYPNDNVILLGDYNDRVVTSIYVGHQSSYQPFVNDVEDYDILTTELDQAGRTSFPSSNGLIDHIAITNELTDEYITNSAGIEDPRLYIANYNATTASDHLPVFARYTLCPPYAPIITAESTTTFCAGGSVILNSTIATSYQWYKDGVAINEATNQTYTATEAGSYTVQVVNSNGCTSTASNAIIVTVNTAVKPTISANGATTFCPGGSVELTSSASSGYLWNTTATTQSITVTQTGNYSVIITDANGCSNTSDATTVTVEDTQDPTITAPADVTVNADNGSCAATNVTLGTPTYGDNCGANTPTNDAPSSYPVGETTVTWTVTDVNGSSATATQKVTVTDNQDPTITAPANVTVTADNGSCSAGNVALGTPTAADNCGVSGTTNDHPSTTYPVGVTTVIWTVTDVHGRTATANQTVTVTDNENPTITCVANQTRIVNNTNCSYKAAGTEFDPAAFGDNCPGAAISNNYNNNNTLANAVFPKGNTIVTWTVTDAKGNTSNCTTTVTVNSTIGISIADVYAVQPGGAPNTIYKGYGPSSVTLQASVSGGTAPYSYKWTVGSSAGPAVSSASSFTVSPASTTTYYLNVKDVYGCGAVLATKTIQVVDVRCGPRNDKVTVCVYNKGSYATSCVTSNSVSGYLAKGSYLGECSTIASSANTRTTTGEVSVSKKEQYLNGIFNVIVSPNPTTDHFKLVVQSDKNEPITMRVQDVSGKVISRSNYIQRNETVILGSNLKPGTYFAEVMQGTSRKVIRLIKLR